MNALEKALLIKELNQLIHGLEQGNFSFFEIAKSKSRLIEIFGLCDQPIFKKQILKFKATNQPEEAATDFVNHTLYRHSFRGIFHHDQDLEDRLYQNAQSGWSMLYRAELGWQIWLIPAPNRTALMSEWGDLEDIYPWLLEQQQRYQCLKTDHELNKEKFMLARDRVKALAEIKPKVESHLHQDIAPVQQEQQRDVLTSLTQNFNPAPLHEHIAVIPLLMQQEADDLTLEQKPAALEQQEISTAVEMKVTAPSPTQPDAIAHLPKNLDFTPYTALLHPLDDQTSTPTLYGIDIPSLPNITQYVDLLFHASELELWQQQPIYLAEQSNAQNQFSKYLILFGAEDEMQAIRLMNQFTERNQQHMVAIKSISWDQLHDSLMDFETLFACYSEHALFVWHIEHYIPFMPASLFQSQKFISFEERPAHAETPLILLKERQKIRMIYGQNRLNLSQHESAYPYLLLDRQQGISWQIIKTILDQLESPIDGYELYEAIQKHISH